MKGFTVGTAASAVYFGMYSIDPKKFDLLTYYLIPGMMSERELPTLSGLNGGLLFPVYFPQKVCVFAFTCSVSAGLSAGQNATFRFYVSGTEIAGSSIQLTSSISHLAVTSVSATILTSQNLSVSCQLDGTGGTIDHICKFSCSVYVY